VLTSERHYSLDELCELWFGPRRPFTPSGKPTTCHPKYHTVRRWFIGHDGKPKPGVLNSGNGKHNFLEVPESVAFAEYERRTTRRRAA